MYVCVLIIRAPVSSITDLATSNYEGCKFCLLSLLKWYWLVLEILSGRKYCTSPPPAWTDFDCFTCCLLWSFQFLTFIVLPKSPLPFFLFVISCCLSSSAYGLKDAARCVDHAGAGFIEHGFKHTSRYESFQFFIFELIWVNYENTVGAEKITLNN